MFMESHSNNIDVQYPSWLLLDDWRTFDVDEVARTMEDAQYFVESKVYEGLLLDYDLGRGGNGLDFLNWLASTDQLIDKVVVVSTHPTGQKKIEERLVELNYVYETGRIELQGSIVKGWWQLYKDPALKPKRKVVVHMSSLRG